MLEKLLLGTGNQTKIAYYKKFFARLQFEILSPKDIGILGEPEETGATLEENSLIKAKWYFEQSGLPTLADDGGFEIPALGNFPGVYSKRFSGREMSDFEVISAILEKMEGFSGPERKARMRTAFTCMKDAQQVFNTGGIIEGHVPDIPYAKIIPHFPYRSLLFVDSLGKWFYELTPEDEDRLGYRKKVVEQVKQFLLGG